MDQGSCQIECMTDSSASLAGFLADASKHQPRPEFVNGSHLIDIDTVLTHCIKLRNIAGVRALLSAGAMPNSAGINPISKAAHIGNLEIMRLLISSGAVVNSASSTGSTAMIQAAHFGHLEAVRLLLRHQAAADYANKNGTTALMRAAQEGHAGIVTCSIEAGVDVNKKNHDGMNALLLAAYRGHGEIASILVRAGAMVNVQTDSMRSTPLMLACKRGYEACAEMLISLGADVDIRDKCMRTAQDFTALYKIHGTERIGYPTEILPGFLFLGDSHHGSSEEMMADLRVTHIVDATSTYASRNNAQKLKIVYLHIPVKDSTGVDIRQHFQSVLDFVALAKSTENGRVLIHCRAGISRSSTFVLAYLMYNGGCSSLKASLEHVVLQRPCVMPNVSFRAQLMDYEETLFGTRSFADDSAFLACMGAVAFRWGGIHNPCMRETNKSAQDPSGVTVTPATAVSTASAAAAAEAAAQGISAMKTSVGEGSAASVVVMM